MFGTSEKRNIFFSLLFIKIFTIIIEHSFPFNWSLWLFFVGMTIVGLCESSWNQRYWISRLQVKKNISEGKVLIIFVMKHAELLVD